MRRLIEAAAWARLSGTHWFNLSVVLISGLMLASCAFASLLFAQAGSPSSTDWVVNLFVAWCYTTLASSFLINQFRLRDMGISGWHQVWYLGLSICLLSYTGSQFLFWGLIAGAGLALAVAPSAGGSKDALSPSL